MAKIKAELIENNNDDLHVVNAARVSFDKESKEFTYREDVPKGSDEGLVNYLATHDHWTPFSHIRFTFSFDARYSRGPLDLTDFTGSVVKVLEDSTLKIRHSLYGWANWIKRGLVSPELANDISNTLVYLAPECSKALGIFGDPLTASSLADYLPEYEETDPDFIDVTLRETVPIFVARQRFKHMVGFTYNEVSRRYVDDEPTFYVPDSWRSRPDGSVKQGSGEDVDPESNSCFNSLYGSFLDKAFDLYEMLLDHQVAPEQARMVLPQSMMTSYYVTGSLTAYARMVKQRLDPHAQKEIQDLSELVDSIMAEQYPTIWKELLES